MKMQFADDKMNLPKFFSNPEFAQLFKVKEGRFTATIDGQTIFDVEARTVTDEETGEQSRFVWYVSMQIYPMFESVPLPQICICPQTASSHNPSCSYYAPSPQEIYKESL